MMATLMMTMTVMGWMSCCKGGRKNRHDDDDDDLVR
jgi:hypothetical protein